MNAAQNDFGTEFFASANYFANRNRTAMDDVESLLYTMWSVSGVPMGGPSGKYPEGKALLQSLNDGTQEAWMLVRSEIFYC